MIACRDFDLQIFDSAEKVQLEIFFDVFLVHRWRIIGFLFHRDAEKESCSVVVFLPSFDAGAVGVGVVTQDVCNVVTAGHV